MKFEYSFHWQNQKRFRLEITDDLIEYSILNSEKLNQKIDAPPPTKDFNS